MSSEEKQDSKSRKIYYMIIDVAYKKNKSMQHKEMWAVSSYDTPGEIMANDEKTMHRIDRELYGKTKAVRHIMIRKIKSKVFLGYTNSNS